MYPDCIYVNQKIHKRVFNKNVLLILINEKKFEIFLVKLKLNFSCEKINDTNLCVFFGIV